MEKKKKNRDWNNILFVSSIVCAAVFLTAPIILKIPVIHQIAKIFLKSLETMDYKASYFEACGGLIGSFLAITSAVWLQKKTEKNQKKCKNVKSATIIYYDITLFYKENEILASKIASLLNKDGADRTLKHELGKIKNSARVYIDANWIANVAELTGVLSQEEIEIIYEFYGMVAELKRRLESVQTTSRKEMETLKKLYYDVGDVKELSHYDPNSKIKDVLTKLKKIMEASD